MTKYPALLAALCIAACASAAEPAAPAAPPSGPVVELPTVKVQERRIKAIDAELKRIDKQIAVEKKKMKATDLDKSLNGDKLAKSAAILGGNSAAHMEAVAATRVALLENERAMLERLKFPRTAEDQALIEKELVNLRTTRRHLDDAAKQR
ncbi:MAG: hypothetical protein HYX71_01525 [Opitutae bacterium]|nr:hypothetical protein [Opitutae bacterium]